MSQIKKISLKDYYIQLLQADWFYSYSDCYDTRNKAYAEISRLKVIGKSHPIALKMWKDCQEFVGKSWNNPNTKDFYCPKINAEFSYRLN